MRKESAKLHLIGLMGLWCWAGLSSQPALANDVRSLRTEPDWIKRLGDWLYPNLRYNFAPPPKEEKPSQNMNLNFLELNKMDPKKFPEPQTITGSVPFVGPRNRRDEVATKTWEKAQSTKKPKTLPDYIKAQEAGISTAPIDRTTLKMCNLPSNANLESCKALIRALERQEVARTVDKTLAGKINNPVKDAVKTGTAATAGIVAGIGATALVTGPASLLVGPPVGAATVLAVGITSELLDWPIHNLRLEARVQEQLLLGYIRTLPKTAYAEMLCSQYQGKYMITTIDGERIGQCYSRQNIELLRTESDGVKRLEKLLYPNELISLGKLQKAHEEACKQGLGPSATAGAYVDGNKVICRYNNEYRALERANYANLIKNCAPHSKPQSSQQSCGTYLAQLGNKNPATAIAKKDQKSGTEQRIAQAQSDQRGTPTQSGQLSTAPTTESSQPSTTPTAQSQKSTKHQLILEAIRQEKELNEIKVKNFEKLIKAKQKEIEQNMEFHQAVQEFLMRKIAYDKLTGEEKLAQQREYIKAQQENINRIEKFLNSPRMDNIKRYQQAGVTTGQ